MSTQPNSVRPQGPKRQRVYRVASLNRLVRFSLEERWGDVWVEGELSDVRPAASGHVYFTLNDEQEPAQLRSVMFRTDARRAKARLRDGERVQLRGSLSLFEPRGSFQLIARIALPAGRGDLHAQFQRVCAVLQQEGLLDPDRKRSLPRIPQNVGIVTSPRGAAVHDIIQLAAGRCPVRLVLAPCLVQGADAPASIVRALAAIQRLPGLQVVIVGRGGGASEDLSAFNDERVARAVAGCKVPVVSAVGHEIDLTVTDLVADLRAATPSNAVELVVPDRAALQGELDAHTRALQRAMELSLERLRLRLERAAQLDDPRAALAGARRRFERLAHATRSLIERRAQQERSRLATLHGRLLHHDVRSALARDKVALMRLDQRLRAALQPRLARRRSALSRLTATLDALSPLSILERGYAIAMDAQTGQALTDSSQVEPGASLDVRLHRGSLRTRVETTT